jgi:hypothetical protein
MTFFYPNSPNPSPYSLDRWSPSKYYLPRGGARRSIGPSILATPYLTLESDEIHRMFCLVEEQGRLFEECRAEKRRVEAEKAN